MCDVVLCEACRTMLWQILTEAFVELERASHQLSERRYKMWLIEVTAVCAYQCHKVTYRQSAYIKSTHK